MGRYLSLIGLRVQMVFDRKLEGWVKVVLCVLGILIIGYRPVWRTFRELGC